MGKDRKYSIGDLDNLIKSIKSDYNLIEEEISVRLGYNEGYISQTRARGFVPDKFMEALKREFAKSNHIADPNEDKAGNGQQMASGAVPTAQLLETINLLVRQNDKLADTNRLLAEKITTIPVGEQSEIQRSVDAMLQGLREFVLKLSVGSRYKSLEEARSAYRKELGDVIGKRKAKDTQSG